MGWALLLFFSPRPSSDCCPRGFPVLMLFLTCRYRTPPTSLYFSFLLNMFSVSYPLPLRFTLWEWCVVSMALWRERRLARSAAPSLCGWASALTSHRLRFLNHEVHVRAVLTLQSSFTGIRAVAQTPGGTVPFRSSFHLILAKVSKRWSSRKASFPSSGQFHPCPLLKVI